MLRSTFLGYKTATSALRTNQNIMDVVGQNLSNINTKGYTRQRLDINSVSFNARNLKYGTAKGIIGQGVETSGVSQYRDSFLDFRYRTEAAKVGNEQVQFEALSDLEDIFDEIISNDGLDSQFTHLLEQLQSLTSNPSDPVFEGVVRTSAEMLTQMFNNYSRRIDTIKEQQYTYLNDGAIEKVNQLMDNIAKLNNQIKESNISGNSALELNDERNLLIDELSNYLDIEVSLEPLSIGGNKTIDLLSIKLKSNGMKLVNDSEAAEIGLGKGTYKDDVSIKLVKTVDDTEDPAGGGKLKFEAGLDLTQQIDRGQIGGYIKFLNGKGDFSTSGDDFETSKGIQYYEKMLDVLANKFAAEMNNANKNVKTDNDGNPIIVGEEYQYEDRPLFSARGEDPNVVGSDIITAANIKISEDWANSTSSYLTNTVIPTTGDDDSGATDNILKMISLFNREDGNFKFSTNIDGTGKQLFEGTLQEFMSYTTTRLNLQVSDVKTSYNTYAETMYTIDYEKSSISSVDLNEEGVNLLQYSKSYNAAARLMTTLDEMLDTLINRMGV
jgi:flagellar hook-associated protein 1 FlgK